MNNFRNEIFTFVEINDDWAPTDEESSRQRSMFYCQSVDAHIRQNLAQIIAKCKSGTMGAETQIGVQQRVDEWVLSNAVKDATSTCIHLSGLQQGGQNAPEWLNKFIFDSQQEADAIAPEPAAIDIIGARSHLDQDDLLNDLFEQLRTDFGISPNSEAADLLKEQLENSAGLARELLVLSLTQPAENLNRHLQMYQ
ncbi:MAG: hypothetical protein K2X81_29600 [Candidatus Obscuribacterales bacterium]|nr:hypothetical protein [Candidatus Obscuribacterales bacterium]